jgi:hypothetical protein
MNEYEEALSTFEKSLNQDIATNRQRLVGELDSIRKDEVTMNNFKGMANGLISFTDGIKTSQRMIRNLRE